MISSLDWVIRGGLSTPQNLQSNYREHLAVPGLFGFSVQYNPGSSVDALALAGRFRNSQISFALAVALFAAVTSTGYQAHLTKSPGGGFHFTFGISHLATGVAVQRLPGSVAHAISQAFQRGINPHPIP